MKIYWIQDTTLSTREELILDLDFEYKKTLDIKIVDNIKTAIEDIKETNPDLIIYDTGVIPSFEKTHPTKLPKLDEILGASKSPILILEGNRTIVNQLRQNYSHKPAVTVLDERYLNSDAFLGYVGNALKIQK